MSFLSFLPQSLIFGLLWIIEALIIESLIFARNCCNNNHRVAVNVIAWSNWWHFVDYEQENFYKVKVKVQFRHSCESMSCFRSWPKTYSILYSTHWIWWSKFEAVYELVGKFSSIQFSRSVPATFRLYCILAAQAVLKTVPAPPLTDTDSSQIPMVEMDLKP